MRVGSQRILAVTARTERIGCVVVEDGDLVFWQGSASVSGHPEQAGEQLARWIREFRPDIVISQDPDAAGRKRGAQLDVLRTFARVGAEAPVVNLFVRRRQPFANAYLEAQYLASHFPDLEDMVPTKPPIWRKESYSLVFFEALALVRDAGLLKPIPETPDGTDS